MKNVIKDYLAYAILVGMASFVLFILILVSIYGDFGVYEPSLAILILEIAACIGALVLGIERVRNLIKRHNGKRKVQI